MPCKARMLSCPRHEQQACGFGCHLATVSLCVLFPCSWDVLVENLLDPSHVPNAHHGIQGNRRAPSPHACSSCCKAPGGGLALKALPLSLPLKGLCPPLRLSLDGLHMTIVKEHSLNRQVLPAGTRSWAGTSRSRRRRRQIRWRLNRRTRCPWMCAARLLASASSTSRFYLCRRASSVTFFPW